MPPKPDAGAPGEKKFSTFFFDSLTYRFQFILKLSVVKLPHPPSSHPSVVLSVLTQNKLENPSKKPHWTGEESKSKSKQLSRTELLQLALFQPPLHSLLKLLRKVLVIERRPRTLSTMETSSWMRSLLLLSKSERGALPENLRAL